MAEVNDKGEVRVEGEFAGRLEGFRFHADPSATGDEARMLTRAAYEALRPEFHLRADRFYNAPDTELDFTEQGGLMWGSSAVGKLVKGSEAMKPGVEPFVDEEAGAEIVEKVRRRLQHFIDRKVATAFEPLIALKSDETLNGLARGFAFRLVETLGVLPREGVAAEVKELDQDARGSLRKHGVRFGQFTIFQPALLKPAPTRLRLVLWGLDQGMGEFPESPPPGLVTIPYLPAVPKGYYTLSGYHPAGDRAIRIDMLERLADMLRNQDSRAGFEALPDMLSITGMTLEQFAGLMQGLGYRAEKAERVKARAEAAPAAEPVAAAEPDHDHPLTEEESVLVAETRAQWEAEQAARKAAEPEAAEAGETAEPVAAEAAAAPEMEVYYTFTWAPRPRGNRRPERGGERGGERGSDRQGQQGDRPARPPQGERGPRRDREAGAEGGQGKREGGRFEGKRRDENRGERPERGDRGPKGKPRHEGKGKPRHEGPKNFEAHPPRAEKKIDPDSPFAILASLKNKS